MIDNRFQLLDLPYPFKASLSICSDIDGTSWENFFQIHEFLNSEKETSLGRGLNLPIGDSFWMFDNPDYPNAAFSYFDVDKNQTSRHAPKMRELIGSGILDVMHGYGNFASAEEFSRDLAIKALNELEKYNLKLKIWTNHGGIENVQSIGKTSQGKGDIIDPSQQFYHSDLLIKYGIKFYWDCELSLTPVIGQDRRAAWKDYYWRNPLHFSFQDKSRALAKGFLNFLPDFFIKKIIGNRIFFPNKAGGNAIFNLDKLRDDNFIFKFRRFGSGRYDWSDDLPNILNDRVLKKLLQTNGKMIVYVHLGDIRSKESSLPLTETTIAKFRQLADLFYRKLLWLATTEQILTYALVTRYLDWDVTENESNYLININGLKNIPLKYELEKKDLAGLCFSVPSDKSAKLIFKDKIVETVVFSDKNSTKQIISVPIKKIEWPF